MKRGKHHRYAEHLRMEDEYPDNIWDATMSWRRKDPPVLGYEFWDIAVGRLVKKVIRPHWKSRVVAPKSSKVISYYPLTITYDPQLIPHAMDPVPDGMEVIALTQAKYGAGHYQIVAINAGSNQGVEPGHVFSAFRPGKRIQDEVKYPTGSWADQKTLNGDKVTFRTSTAPISWFSGSLMKSVTP